MGNAVTCSLVDVVGTVTVTQANGHVLEFVQPVFASQVKKLHPGNWLVHYVSVANGQDKAAAAVGDRRGKMAILHGAEELHPGQMYFLLPIPSYVRKQVFGSKQSGVPQPKPVGTAEAATSIPPGASVPCSPAPPASRMPSLQPFKPTLNGTIARSFRQQDSNPVFSAAAESSAAQLQRDVQPAQVIRKPKGPRKQKFYVLDWRPTLVTIEEVF